MDKPLIDILKPLASKTPPKIAIKASSFARNFYLNFIDEPDEIYIPPEEIARELWGLQFSGPLMNAAGIYKKADDYYAAVMQGAAGILLGTFTYNPQKGAKIKGTRNPFASYPNSEISSNKIGLKNPGIKKGLEGLPELDRVGKFPIGASLTFLLPDEGLKHLTESMKIAEAAGIDFIEIDASCPNTGYFYVLEDILEHADRNYLQKRKRYVPVVVKLSNDTRVKDVGEIMVRITSHRFDGVNFGNTTTEYEFARKFIHPKDLNLFDYFTANFGGGISGAPLKEKSLALSREAIRWLKQNPQDYEINIIRTGGIDSYEDLAKSDNSGINMNEWMTGMWKDIRNPYKKIINDYAASIEQIYK